MSNSTKLPTTLKNQVDKELGSSLASEMSEWSPECKIYVCNQGKPTDLCGSGVLVYDRQADVKHSELSEYCIITSNKVIKNENFKKGHYKVEFSKNSTPKSFDLFRVKKTVWNIPSAGQVIIFIDPNCQELRHVRTGQCRILSTCLTIAERDPDQQSFCYVANQRYFVKSDSNGENGKHFLEADNNHSANNAAKDLEKADGTAIFQGATEGEKKAVGIFNVVHKTQMEIFPMWFNSKITDILATANQQPTAGANGTYPGAPPANELFPPPNGRGGVDGGERASEDDGNNGDGDPPQDPPNSTETSTGTQSYENLPAAPPSSTGANTTNNQELPAAGSDHTTEANQQPTAGPTDTGGQPNPTGPASMSSRPVQEEQGTVGNGHTSTGAERARQEETVSKQLVSEAVTENTLLLEKLSKMLDREIRIIKCWKHLAYILEVPDKIRKKWDMYTEHSPTEDLLSHVTNENPDLTVQQLKKKLETIFRNDVIEDLNKGGYKDEASVVELFAEDPKFNNILSRLDEKTMHNYKNLAKEFKINTLKIDQLGMRFSGGPTAFLFYYMSFTEGLKDLTMHQLRKHFEEMKLIKLAKIVTKATNEDSDLVKDVVVEGSDVLEEIADNLNHKKQSLKNWRHLAHKLGILRDVYESFDTSKEDSHSPTKIMFEWLQQAKPNLTVENLLDGLEQIERLDVKQEVTFALTKKKKQKSKNDSTQVYDTAH